MKIEVESGSPDGMSVTYETYLLTWKELKEFIDHVAKWENRKCDKILKDSKPELDD